MQRRDALRLLVAGAALPTFTPEVFALFRGAHPAEGYAVRTLNPHQNATVITMTDLIIPETNTPGAKSTRVNEFIDLILTEWANDDERANFLNGLADVDKQSNELFGKDFVNASPAQQTALLRSIDDDAMARFLGGTKSGAPASGSWQAGDFVIDQTGKVWIYTGSAWVSSHS